MTWFQKPPLGTPLDWGNPLNDETVLALAMNEGHGDKLQDLSMNGNHGTLNNFAFPPTVASGWNPGQTGVGLNFDGADDFIDHGLDPSLEMQCLDFVLSALVKPTTNDSKVIIGKERFSTESWGIYQVGGSFYFRLRDAVDSATVVSDSAYTIGDYYHVAAVRKNNVLYMYVNGIEQTATPACTFCPATSAKIFYVGRRVQDNGYNFAGSIDQPRAQSRAWTAKECMDYAINPWQVYLDE